MLNTIWDTMTSKENRDKWELQNKRYYKKGYARIYEYLDKETNTTCIIGFKEWNDAKPQYIKFETK